LWIVCTGTGCPMAVVLKDFEVIFSPVLVCLVHSTQNSRLLEETLPAGAGIGRKISVCCCGTLQWAAVVAG
jgi:hypothetical protein